MMPSTPMNSMVGRQFQAATAFEDRN
jgi:hypothetical protein